MIAVIYIYIRILHLMNHYYFFVNLIGLFKVHFGSLELVLTYSLSCMVSPPGEPI